MKRFTDKSIKSLKPRGKRYEVSDPGSPLFIRVQPSSSKSFVIYYKNKNSSGTATYVIGKFGDAPNYTLRRARLEADRLLELRDKGTDPIEERNRLEQQKIDESMTVAELAEHYIKNHSEERHSERHQSEVKRYLYKEIIPYIGQLKVKEVTRADTAKVIRRKKNEGFKTAANRVHSCLYALFSHAIRDDEIDIIEHHPMFLSKKPYIEYPKERSLNEDEIRKLWYWLHETDQININIRVPLLLILTTLQRPGEVCQMQISQFDESVWEIPRTVTKNKKKAHRVPLSPLSIDLIQQAYQIATGWYDTKLKWQHRRALSSNIIGPTYLHPSPRGIDHIDNSALTRALNRVDLPIEKFTPHDLRRTGTTLLNKLGYDGIDMMILNHSPTGVTKTVYNKYRFEREKGEALNTLSKYLCHIIGLNENDLLQSSLVKTFSPSDQIFFAPDRSTIS